MTEKAPGAFRTIGELAKEIGVPQHSLRFWERQFPQLRPMTRAGNRRYYREADVALVKRIHALLHEQGYTIKGVQKLLGSKTERSDVPVVASPSDRPTPLTPAAPANMGLFIASLQSIRAKLVSALEQSTLR